MHHTSFLKYTSAYTSSIMCVSAYIFRQTSCIHQSSYITLRHISTISFVIYTLSPIHHLTNLEFKPSFAHTSIQKHPPFTKKWNRSFTRRLFTTTLSNTAPKMSPLNKNSLQRRSGVWINFFIKFLSDREFGQTQRIHLHFALSHHLPLSYPSHHFFSFQTEYADMLAQTCVQITAFFWVQGWAQFRHPPTRQETSIHNLHHNRRQHEALFWGCRSLWWGRG